jgi:CRISPR-associated protein Cmr4
MPHTRIYWLHCLSPTHAGIGRGLGYIDLPIDREAITGWPIIRSSAFKGVLADYYGATEDKRRNTPLLRAAFGVSGAEEDSNSGSLIPTDARLLCLPIRSFRGTFAWVTSPLCLQRFRELLELTGTKDLPQIPAVPQENQACCADNSVLLEQKRVYLEELDFEAATSSQANDWAKYIGERVFKGQTSLPGEFQKRFLVVSDLAFDFFCEAGTEVHTRVRIDDGTKTVAEGALWTEETLPAETILAGLIQCERIFQKNGTARSDITPDKVLQEYASQTLTLQIGGKATVGRGLVRCIFTEVGT